MVYRRLKRTWSHGCAHYDMDKFSKAFPELDKLDREALCDRLIDAEMDFYTEKTTPVSIWIRFTLLFALVLFILMFVFIPINFLVTGRWGYALGKKNKILNWFKALKLQ